jgi:hypothetical protein
MDVFSTYFPITRQILFSPILPCQMQFLLHIKADAVSSSYVARLMLFPLYPRGQWESIHSPLMFYSSMAFYYVYSKDFEQGCYVYFFTVC